MKTCKKILLLLVVFTVMMSLHVFADESELFDEVIDYNAIEDGFFFEDEEYVEDVEELDDEYYIYDEAFEFDGEYYEMVPDESIKVVLNGENLDFTDDNGNKVEPQIINDRTMVPMRKIFEALGAEIRWNPVDRAVRATKDGIEITLQIDNNIATIKKGEETSEITLDAAPVIYEDRTLVPVRFIAESLNKDVDWDGESRSVIINDKAEEENTSVIIGEEDENTPPVEISEEDENAEYYVLTPVEGEEDLVGITYYNYWIESNEE